ncbi:hypothetical protein HMPREF1614_03332 [Escherichia coli 908624]|nr:hypothetical protein HMPREF9553_04536 [Escherichia coli MS 200-1]ESD96893.1 hypothetical protein HMPREF1614_03332 [Escherichia coli 908624]
MAINNLSARNIVLLPDGLHLSGLRSGYFVGRIRHFISITIRHHLVLLSDQD